jgi:hypothetical protein
VLALAADDSSRSSFQNVLEELRTMTSVRTSHFCCRTPSSQPLDSAFSFSTSSYTSYAMSSSPVSSIVRIEAFVLVSIDSTIF